MSLILLSELLTDWLPKIGLDLNLPGFVILSLHILLVIGGIYAGVFSPTEAGAVGAFGTLVLGVAKRRITWDSFVKSLLGAGRITAMAFLILIGAMVFGYFLTVTRLPFEMADLVSNLPLNRYFILGFILLVYLILGCMMEVLGMIILIVPIFFPTIMALGFDPIWFGILTVRAVEIGQITPPVGINVFVIKAVCTDVSLETIYRGIIPFFFGDICLLIFLVAFWIYNDGIGTIIKMATIYGAEIGIDATALIGALLVTQFVGIP